MYGDEEVKGWKILVVDDDEDNRTVAAQYLAFLGAEVRTAENGAVGLGVLRSFTPTFVLLDLSMPEMDGWEMHRRLRADPATAGLPVIALTAHAMQEDTEKALGEGFDGYITKPFLLNSLIADIKRTLAECDNRRPPL
jgi:two-component system, cell cycle response regulator DivK